MKGTLHKTESGWQVWYHAKGELYHSSIRVKILPLLQEDAAGLFIQDTDSQHDGQEVEFEIVEFPVNSISKYAKLVDKATRPLTEDDAWPKYPEVKIVCPRCKALMPCTCNVTWYDIMAESNSYDDSEILAYIIKNYNPPTKKQEDE
jgi:hypothetical protein